MAYEPGVAALADSFSIPPWTAGATFASADWTNMTNTGLSTPVTVPAAQYVLFPDSTVTPEGAFWSTGGAQSEREMGITCVQAAKPAFVYGSVLARIAKSDGSIPVRGSAFNGDGLRFQRTTGAGGVQFISFVGSYSTSITVRWSLGRIQTATEEWRVLCFADHYEIWSRDGSSNPWTHHTDIATVTVPSGWPALLAGSNTILDDFYYAPLYSPTPTNVTLTDIPQAGLELEETLPTGIALTQILAPTQAGLELGTTLPSVSFDRNATLTVPEAGISLGTLNPTGFCEDETPVCGQCTTGQVICGRWKLCMHLPGLSLGTSIPDGVLVEEVGTVPEAGLELGVTLPAIRIDAAPSPPVPALALGGTAPAIGISSLLVNIDAGVELGAYLPDFVGVRKLMPLPCTDVDPVAAPCGDLVLVAAPATDLVLEPAGCD